MRTRVRGLCFAAAIAIAMSGGCASKDDTKAERATPESQGFRWVGQGEPSNFGADYNFCTRTVARANVTRLDPYRDPLQPEQVQRIRGDYATKRDFWQCMEGRGWELASGQPRSAEPR